MSRTLVACAGALLVALPALTAPAAKKEVKPDGPVTPALLMTTTENLKHIGLAFHNYHDEHGALPTNLRAKDGKPGLSWRVAILPFLNEEGLYKQFKLDEPWDSEHNKKLIQKIPTVYTPVRGRAQAGQTFYQMFAGKQTALDPDGNRITLAHVTDGLSNTFLAAEAGKAVTWTRPDDMPFDGKDLPALGGMFDGKFHVAMGDGSVKRVPKGTDPEALKLSITRDDGQSADLDAAIEQARPKE